MRLVALTFVAVAAAADLPYIDVFMAADSGGNSSASAPISMWSPSFIVTKRNTLVINAQCDRKAQDHDSIMGIARSEDPSPNSIPKSSSTLTPKPQNPKTPKPQRYENCI